MNPNAWEQRRLGDISNPQQWKTLNSNDMTKIGYPVFGANGYIGFYSEYNHEKETIAITCRGATCGQVTLVKPKSYITGNSMCLDELDENNILKYFLYTTLCKRGFEDIISGSAQPQITRSNIIKIYVFFPTLPEQQKIGQFFSHLDSLITLHQRKEKY